MIYYIILNFISLAIFIKEYAIFTNPKKLLSSLQKKQLTLI
jgi:hypothetical protein